MLQGVRALICHRAETLRVGWYLSSQEGRRSHHCSAERLQGQATSPHGEVEGICYITLCIQSAKGSSRVWGGEGDIWFHSSRARPSHTRLTLCSADVMAMHTVQEPCRVTPWLPEWPIHSSRALPGHAMETFCLPNSNSSLFCSWHDAQHWPGFISLYSV